MNSLDSYTSQELYTKNMISYIYRDVYCIYVIRTHVYVLITPFNQKIFGIVYMTLSNNYNFYIHDVKFKIRDKILLSSRKTVLKLSLYINSLHIV